MSIRTNSCGIQLWQVDLSDPAWDALCGVLSHEETQRAARLRGQLLRQRFERRRAAARWLLADCAGFSPRAVHFRYGAYGKPEFPGQPWHFSLSHSGDLAVFAIARVPIGVDIEHRQPDIDVQAHAGFLCHRDELDDLARMTPDQHVDQLFRLWTRKEAYCKATGAGHLLPPRDVRLAADRWVASGGPAGREPVRWRAHDEAKAGRSTHWVFDLTLEEACPAALCAPMQDPSITLLNAVPQPWGLMALEDDASTEKEQIGETDHAAPRDANPGWRTDVATCT